MIDGAIELSGGQAVAVESQFGGISDSSDMSCKPAVPWRDGHIIYEAIDKTRAKIIQDGEKCLLKLAYFLEKLLTILVILTYKLFLNNFIILIKYYIIDGRFKNLSMNI